jgi:hypothetical protein
MDRYDQSLFAGPRLKRLSLDELEVQVAQVLGVGQYFTLFMEVATT